MLFPRANGESCPTAPSVARVAKPADPEPRLASSVSASLADAGRVGAGIAPQPRPASFGGVVAAASSAGGVGYATGDADDDFDDAAALAALEAFEQRNCTGNGGFLSPAVVPAAHATVPAAPAPASLSMPVAGMKRRAEDELASITGAQATREAPGTRAGGIAERLGSGAPQQLVTAPPRGAPSAVAIQREPHQASGAIRGGEATEAVGSAASAQGQQFVRRSSSASLRFEV